MSQEITGQSISTPQSAAGLLLGSRQMIITGNREQTSLDLFATQLWPFNDQDKAFTLRWQVKFCSSVHLLQYSATENLQPCTLIYSDCNNNNGLPVCELKLQPSSDLLNSSHQCRHLSLSAPASPSGVKFSQLKQLKLMSDSSLHMSVRWKTNRA